MLLKKLFNRDKISLQQMMNRISLLKYQHLGSFPSGYVPTLDKDNFAFIKTQPSNMQGEHWIKIANSRHKFHFAVTPGRPSFFKQQYKQMIPEPIQSQPSVCSFHTINATFHLFKFRQAEITKFHNFIVFSFLSNYMYFLDFFYVNLHDIQCVC